MQVMIGKHLRQLLDKLSKESIDIWVGGIDGSVVAIEVAWFVTTLSQEAWHSFAPRLSVTWKNKNTSILYDHYN